MIGKTVGHYEIIEKVGEGGMGVVYRAEDTRLKRTIALKFLPTEAITKEEQTRFIREAQAASALDHPNICTIHEVNETDDDRTYIAMAFCDGETVKEMISRGSLKLEEAIDIAIQMGEGLARAHKEGIVHRDIKPANAILTKDGTVKIVDFGLAKISGATQLTKTGTSMGTAAYMSPEQIRGEEVDHRTDIWALGVMLYEMVTGEQPFTGENDTAVIYSVLNEDPETITSIRQDIPRDLGDVVGKALVKDPANRYQHTGDVVEDLRNLLSAENAQSEWEKSIIVLPFDDMSPDKDNEYFSDGLTEEIITDLSHIHDLLVISRSSAMTFKGTKKKIKEIAREVNVQYVLEGSVRKAGNNLRITAQLIDATNDAHLWAEKYSGTLDNIFDIQEQVSREIVDALRVKLSPAEDQKLAERPIKNMQAYECYLKARQDAYTFTKDGLDRALRYLQNGLEIVGKNAVLYAGMGFVYSQYVNIGLAHEEYIKKAEGYASKALALDSGSLEAHFVLGFLNMCFHGNPKKSIHHYKQAITIFPDDPDVLIWLITGYGTNWGKPKEARQSYNRLMQVDPFNPWAHCGYIIDVMVDGKFDLPVDYLTKWFRMEPQNPAALFFCVQFLAYCSHFKEACTLVSKNAQPDKKDSFIKLSLFVKYAIEGDRKRIQELLTVDFVKTAKRDAQTSYFVSGLFALSRMKDEAFDWLENAVDRGFINYPFISEYDPFLQSIRGEERFKKLMERVKHEWENFEV